MCDWKRTNRQGRSDRRLPQLNRVLTILDEYFSTLTPEQFPRSLSLFQITVGVLSSKPEFTGYFQPILHSSLERTINDLSSSALSRKGLFALRLRGIVTARCGSRCRQNLHVTFIDLKVLTNLTKDDQRSELLAASRRLTGLRASVKRRRRATRELSVGSPHAVAPTERG